MAQPNRAHPTWRNKEAPLFHLVSHSNLAIGRLLNGIGNHRVLNRCLNAVLDAGLFAIYILESDFPTGTERKAYRIYSLS